MIILLLIFPSLRRFSYWVTDHYFFSDYIDLSMKMEAFTAAMSNSKLIDQVFQETVNFLQKNIGAQNVIIFIYDATTKDRLVQAWPCSKSEFIYLSDPITSLTSQAQDVVVLDELLLSPKTELVRRSIAQLKHLDAQLAISFGTEEKVFGIIFVGPKSQDMYSKEELDTLLRIANFFKQVVPQISS